MNRLDPFSIMFLCFIVGLLASAIILHFNL